MLWCVSEEKVSWWCWCWWWRGCSKWSGSGAPSAGSVDALLSARLSQREWGWTRGFLPPWRSDPPSAEWRKIQIWRKNAPSKHVSADEDASFDGWTWSFRNVVINSTNVSPRLVCSGSFIFVLIPGMWSMVLKSWQSWEREGGRMRKATYETLNVYIMYNTYCFEHHCMC